MPDIHLPSCKSLLVQVRSGGALQGTATAFLVSREGTDYLVTNRHVTRGKDGIVPDCLTVVHHRAGSLGTWEGRDERLYDDNGEPLWLEHPIHPDFDVAVLPLTRVSGIERYAYDPWATGPDVAFRVSDPLSIIGFPFGFTGGGAFGIWARGFVATEPEIDWNDLPVFLIDSRTREGQSGSPVIAFYAGGMVPMEDGRSAMFNGPVERLLGVYSGRINAQSDLGFVWRVSVVREIIEGARRAVV
jgi:S1-C subfamily serine protease